MKDYDNNDAYREDKLIKFWGKENAEELLKIRDKYKVKSGYGLTTKTKQHTDIEKVIGENTKEL